MSATLPSWEHVGDHVPYLIKEGVYHYHFKFGLVDALHLLSDDEIKALEDFVKTLNLRFSSVKLVLDH